MTPEPDWMLLDRYLSGACTPDESAIIDAWAGADASHARLLASMRRVWSEAATPLPVVDEEAGWRAVRARIAGAEGAGAPARVSRAPRLVPRLMIVRGRRPAWRSGALAAGIAMIIAAGALATWRSTDHPPASTVRPAREYATARGQRAEVTLIDGTRVWLSVDSRLRVPQSYGTTTRDVELEGEAYFDVQHDGRHPFRVRAGRGMSQDVGTAFDVRAYPGDSESVVIVASGRVALRPVDTSAVHGAGAELGRGQMGRIGRSGSVEVVNGVDLDASLAWRSGRLDFEDRPLRDVARVLERWYDIDIAIDDSSLASVPVTASFTDQSADEALGIVAGALGARYTRHGRHVSIAAPNDTR